QALSVLIPDPSANQRLVTSRAGKREIILKTLLPRHIERFPWSGHIGLNLLPAVIRRIESRRTTLLFTNTRSQTEIWHQALLVARPDWSGDIALHHGSIDRAVREEVEARLRAGTVKCVVCTSSLDLGVDFSPVEQVIQVGGPKGIARMLQRAGRSGHRPGAASRIHCVPAHALELVEFAAVRDGIQGGDMESREPMDRPLDVLVQHLVTLGLGGGFQSAEALTEVRSTHAFRSLSDDEWNWTLDFITKGGRALGAYPQFQRVRLEGGRFFVPDPLVAKFHRMSVGTITSDATMLVKLRSGGNLGSIEEGFIARLRPGDGFFFAGRALELVRTHDMTAVVRPAKKVSRRIPQWLGGKMPLSSQLALAVRRKLAQARRGDFSGPEMQAVAPVMRLQAAWSFIPDPDELLIEHTVSREGFHYFVYPFAGRLAHEGLAALVGHRLGRSAPRTFGLTMNDYGFALSTTVPLELDETHWRRVLSPERLLEDLLDCLNATELARRQFREIARVAGLVFQGYPGTRKSMRQLQASSGLFFDVFARYDPDNLLLQQARREVLERQLEVRRLRLALETAQASRFVLRETKHLTPLAFPLWAMWLQGEVTSESWSGRVKRMVSELEAAAARDDDSGDAAGRRKRRSPNRVGG
ncbi:MAG TPA: helicase-related protein, partial [Verrucomicrobiaceae bacterium]